MPSENSKFYLTREGLRNLKRECDRLRKLKSSYSPEGIPRELYPENSHLEFIPFPDDLRLIENRLTEMDYALRRVELIKIPPKEKRDIVHMGATVVVEVGGKINELEIVGSLETNPSQGRISNESPVGRALLGHRIGDEVVISSSAKAVYTIREINYDSFFR